MKRESLYCSASEIREEQVNMFLIKNNIDDNQVVSIQEHIAVNDRDDLDVSMRIIIWYKEK